MRTLPKTGHAEVDVAATPEQVWDLLTELDRAAEWSHESTGGDWLDGATAPAPGVRFRGRNRQGRNRWTRECVVLEADAPRRLTWQTVRTRLYPDSTVWTYELKPLEGGGCRIVQHYELVSINPLADRWFYLVVPAHRDRSAALREDLRRLGEVAAERTLATVGAR